ncbi:hypothetical protein ROJ8625_02061 [Roseivivax jejudonensis]|uniref:Uncharacterized protein n=1 Tax=Roseivivax jejudonensis TaxID=1529041 RepID=A0A1X6Z6Z7_9RHOB|nr:hypothetical protein ROJ8625_02061 [Roseivivax jejudonensis]
MFDRIKIALRHPDAMVAQDALGAAALGVMLVAALHV